MTRPSALNASAALSYLPMSRHLCNAHRDRDRRHCATGGQKRDVGGVAAVRDADQPGDRREARRVDQPPALAEPDFEHRVEIGRIERQRIGRDGARRNAPGAAKGQPEVGDSPEKFVFAIDKARSANILGESANLFAKYRADLMELNARMDKTIEAQGRLTKDLSPIAAMSE